jgi:hypothetical protein
VKDEVVVSVSRERGKCESTLSSMRSSAGNRRVRELLSMTRNTLNLTRVKR